MSLSKIFLLISGFVLYLFLFIVSIFPISLDLYNNDLGRHLLLGKIIFNTRSVPGTNLLSYTLPDQPFINTHWLSEVIFYLWHSLFGFTGLTVLVIFLAMATFSLLFFTAVKKFDPSSAVIVSLLYLQVLAGRLQVRPELFSYLYLAIFLIILYKFRAKYTKWIFLLIPLQMLWVNSHIYFFNGLAVLFMFLIDAAVKKKVKYASKPFLTLFFVTIAAGVVTLLNPNFLKGATYPLFVLQDYGFPIQENMSFFTALSLSKKITIPYLEASLALLWLSLFLSIKKIPLIDFLLSIFFTFLAFFAMRNFSLFAIGTFIPCVRATSYVLVNVSNKYFQNTNKRFVFQSILLTAFLIAAIPSLQWNLQNHGYGFGVVDDAFDAIDFLRQNKLKGKIYNNYDIGNYLAYRLYPAEKVYVDNRPEAYSADFFQNIYFPTQTSPEIFDKQDKKYNFNIIFIAHTDGSAGMRQLLYRLARDSRWKIVYINSVIVIFVKDTPSNQEIIKKYAISQENVDIRASDFNNKERIGRIANFFSKAGWEEQRLKAAMQFLEFDFEPVNCPVLGFVAVTLQKQKNFLATSYVNRYLKECRP